MCRNIFFMISVVTLATLASSKPIMVAFGTSQGPIVPRQPKSTAAQERSSAVSRIPAPVSEEREDVPNPNSYRPPVPHQYRTKLYALKVPPNLILGTPLDQRYTPYLQKYAPPKNYGRQSKLGVDYTGPNIFEKQDYEINDTKTTLKQSVRYTRPVFVQQVRKRTGDDESNSNSKYVPQIGVIYSSGVRYYVPQITYYNRQSRPSPVDENSVYDVQDEKYYQ